MNDLKNLELKIITLHKKVKELEQKHFDVVDALKIIIENFDKIDNMLSRSLQVLENPERNKYPGYAG